MARFLLVHGSCHGAWCWRDTLPALFALNHEAKAIDLPGHGADPMPIRKVTFDSYVDAIAAATVAETIVVGHAMSGFMISAAAEKAPQKIAHLIYIAAYTPQDGLSLDDVRGAAPTRKNTPAIQTSQDQLSVTLDPSDIEDFFYHDCPEGTLNYAGPRLCPEAIAPQHTPVSLSKAYSSMPKSYVVCKNDRAISPAYQALMAANFPKRNVHEIGTGHSPFFADPNGLASVLDQIAKDVA
ncbi:MAG: alpha/beta fold hydrolase [Paracoccaceae bacterium]